MAKTVKPVLVAEDGHALLQAPTQTAIAALATRHEAASGLGMQVLNLVGSSADGLLDKLPEPMRTGLQGATMRALEGAFEAAAYSRTRLPDGQGWLNTAVTTAMGGVGGVGGLATALAELPVTTTVLLRAIQGIAAEHGFDPAHEDIRRECIMVFAAAGPLERDDAADIAFLAARTTLTGSAMSSILHRVAPRLATVFGQKLATQAVPVLGAVAGAAVNYTFTSYYQEMAHISFGLRRMAEDSDQGYEALLEAFRAEIEAR